MAAIVKKDIESLHEELEQIRKDVDFIKNALKEDFELSDGAKSALTKARKTPESKYLNY